ncbi:MAG: STAS domain-containing protein [Candidatus Gracilibacteria bacterium]|nr:STAS domain-containing protein [Candidatus Gracilibacteria bacterium]
METLIEVNKKEENGIIIFEFSGELDETNADKTFKSIYDAIGDFSGKKIILNMSGLKYLNSKSIGYIADVFSNIEDNDGQMQISNCSDGVKDILELVGITTIVPTVNDEKDAIRAMS